MRIKQAGVVLILFLSGAAFGNAAQKNAAPVSSLDEGRRAWEQKHYDEALKYFTSAINQNPSNADAYNFRGLVLVMQKKYDDALNDFSKVIKLRPRDANACYNRALIYIQQKHMPQQGMDDLNQAIQIDPKYADAYVARARILTSAHKASDAIRDYSQAIALDPQQDAQVFYSRALNYYEAGSYDLAWQDLKEAGRRGADVDPMFIVLVRDKRTQAK